jgi:DNA-binding MarR family transcriptional regulator
MSDFGPAPSDEAFEEELRTWERTQDTRQRIKQVVIGVRDPTSPSRIASRARCSPKTARKHLRDLADERIVLRIDDPQGDRYRRNDEYFAWRRAHRLSIERSEAELLDRLEELEERDREYRTCFDEESPRVVEFPLEGATHDEIHELRESLTAWENVRRDIERYHEALRLARRRSDGMLPAD